MPYTKLFSFSRCFAWVGFAYVKQLKYKIGLCHLALHDTRAALSEVSRCASLLLNAIVSHSSLSILNQDVIYLVLRFICISLSNFSVLISASQLQLEGIPSKARTLRINLTLAKLYRLTGYDRVATGSYRECLR